MDVELKTLHTIELGSAKAKIVVDQVGRKCILVTLAEREVLFTVAHALIIREILDRALDLLTRYTNEPAPSPDEESST